MAERNKKRFPLPLESGMMEDFMCDGFATVTCHRSPYRYVILPKMIIVRFLLLLFLQHCVVLMCNLISLKAFQV